MSELVTALLFFSALTLLSIGGVLASLNLKYEKARDSYEVEQKG